MGLILRYVHARLETSSESAHTMRASDRRRYTPVLCIRKDLDYILQH